MLKPGHVITGDNYFTSLNLSHKLLEQRKIYYYVQSESFVESYPVLNNIKGLPVLTSNFLFNNDNTALTQYIPRKAKNVITYYYPMSM